MIRGTGDTSLCPTYTENVIPAKMHTAPVIKNLRNQHFAITLIFQTDIVFWLHRPVWNPVLPVEVNDSGLSTHEK